MLPDTLEMLEYVGRHVNIDFLHCSAVRHKMTKRRSVH